VPDPSLHELIVGEVVARLAKIAGAPDYWYDLEGRVVRYRHRWTGEAHEYTEIGETPGIAVFDGVHRSVAGPSVGLWTTTIEVVCHFVLAALDAESPDEVTSADLGKAVADIKRALSRNATTDEPSLDWIGAPVFGVEVAIEWLRPDEQAREDGVLARITLNYEDAMGDPSLGV